MSQENVDRFRGCTDAFNRLIEDPRSIQPEDLRRFLKTMDPEVRFEPQQSALQGGYSGWEGVAEWLADLAETYSAGQVEVAEIRDLGDRVLALGTLRFEGTGSGIQTEAPIAVVASFRDGLITGFKDYGDQAIAQEASRSSE
jgi:ketosteroid isomerase-like protein